MSVLAELPYPILTVLLYNQLSLYKLVNFESHVHVHTQPDCVLE